MHVMHKIFFSSRNKENKSILRNEINPIVYVNLIYKQAIGICCLQKLLGKHKMMEDGK